MSIDLDLPFFEEPASHHQRDVPKTVVDAKEEEGPVCSVPHADEHHIEHDGEDSAVDTPFPELNVQWQEHIIRQPTGQRHVPAAPVAGDIQHEEWPFEVLGHLESEHQSHADGHLTISSEVGIHLQWVEQGGKEN